MEGGNCVRGGGPRGIDGGSKLMLLVKMSKDYLFFMEVKNF